MVTRLILILCEGKTEEIYFSIVNRHLRISNGFVEILDKQGQHKSLIKKCNQKRKDYETNIKLISRTSAIMGSDNATDIQNA